MPSRTWKIGLFIACFAVVAYATLFARQFLLGLFIACLLYLVGWLVVQVADAGTGSMGRGRTVVAVVLALVALAYALLIAQQVLLGVVVALTILLVAWATRPDGPVARLLG